MLELARSVTWLQEQASHSWPALVWLVVYTLVLFGVFYFARRRWSIPRERSRQAELAELRRANEVLEDRARERAAELMRKNDQLAEEIIGHERVREALRQSNARLRTLSDAGIIGILTADLQGNIVEANDAFLRMLGYTPEDRLRGSLRWTELTPPEWERQDSHAVEQLKTVGVAQAWEKEYFHKDGSRVRVLVGVAMLDADAGTCVSFVLDLTERKRAQAALEHLRAQHEIDVRFRALLDAAPDAMVVASSGGRIEIINEQTEKLFGYSRHELCGQNLELLVPERFRATHAKHMLSFFAHPSARAMGGSGFELFGRHKNGREIPIEVSLSPLHNQGDLTVSAAIRDISDRRRMEAKAQLMAEELREARNAAEAASNAKSEFLSSMSHELRTPMNAILGFAQLLQRDRKVPLSARHQERVDHIVKSGEHLLCLINDMLDLSRIEAGKVAVAIEPVNVFDVLDEVKATLEPMAARAAIRLDEPDLPGKLPLVAADRTRFVQILLNFGSNAIKYNCPKGKVGFAVSVPTPQFVRVGVRDTGTGIPANQQNKLFQPFQRAGQETGSIEGTGIGLFITKRLADLMRAEVGFSSVSGEGSEFWIDVPIHRTNSRSSSL